MKEFWHLDAEFTDCLYSFRVRFPGYQCAWSPSKSWIYCYDFMRVLVLFQWCPLSGHLTASGRIGSASFVAAGYQHLRSVGGRAHTRLQLLWPYVKGSDTWLVLAKPLVLLCLLSDFPATVGKVLWQWGGVRSLGLHMPNTTRKNEPCLCFEIGALCDSLAKTEVCYLHSGFSGPSRVRII